MGSLAPEPHLGKFRYLTRGAKPVGSKEAYILPPLSAFGDVLTLPLTDLRPSLDLGDDSPFKLSVHGFTARRHHSALHSAPYSRASWNDEKLLREVYFPEVEAFVQQITGCKKVLVSAAVLRSQVYNEDDPPAAAAAAGQTDSDGEPSAGQEDTASLFPPIVGNSKKDAISPAPKVHLDLTPRGARYHIRKYHSQVALAAEGVIAAENRLLSSGVQWDDLKDHYHAKAQGAGAGHDLAGDDGGVPRFALFSIWRPLKTVHRDPLALASCVSFPQSDYAPSDQTEPYDSSIPAYLSQIIDPNAAGAEKEQQQADGDVFHTEGYLAYGPRDEGQKSHGWHYVSEQQPSDVLVIQLFDNEMEANARAPQEGTGKPSTLGVGGAIHSAFELVGQDPEGEARESIEVRCAAFW